MTSESGARTSAIGREAYTTGELLRFGFLNIDKPAGMTSHDVVDAVRRMTGLKRVGHSGTLDPAVTGALPVGLHQATRLLEYLLASGKTYDCEMNVHEALPESRVREVLMGFVGDIEQMPPVRSRVVRRLRTRRIYAIDGIVVEGRIVRFTVDCQAGTYIRTLCVDAGETLGVGAHMTGLRRLRAGPFHADSLISLDAARERVAAWRERGDEAIREWLFPPDIAVPHLPSVLLDEPSMIAFRQGKFVVMAVDSPADAEIAVRGGNGRLAGIARVEAAEPGIAGLRPAKVFEAAVAP